MGDVRRTRRLVVVGARRARHAGASLCQCCGGETAAREGGYRLIDNDKVKPEAIAEGGLGAVAGMAREAGLILAIEDTTTLSYGQAVAVELGTTGSRKEARHRGGLAHLVLWVDADSEERSACSSNVASGAKTRTGKKHARK